MRITSKGQVTIPQHIRSEAGLLPNTDVEFIVDEDGCVRIVKVVGSGQKTRGGMTRGQLAVAALRAAKPHITMTTDEIMALTRGDD